ncbi:ribosomal L1 domain-containing protein 1 [Bombina bombina]|uniref:ribosomal L1 domain-containing protein 1 n=1 Tax=Bombina bombina TaxID=8345 RepID=UPI00235AF7B4|nr:ribosomal L1 domain-containing protein 1 [Bombina bombina]
MAESVEHELDSTQVKKAVQALLAYQKTKSKANALLLNEYDRISLMLTVWKIPNHAQTIRIRLPHEIRTEACDVCLITRDEPDLTSEQTVTFYKKLLNQHGVTHINEIIPLRTIKKEYKPYEAKRRLLSSYDLFLSDDRIRRFLPSLLGKHFYKAKREPLSVNLKTKYLAAELNRYIQGTTLHITNKGCCYSIRVGHTGMKVDDVVENTIAVAKVLATKLPMQWKNVKLLHLKTQTSVALPVYNSPLTNMNDVQQTRSTDKDGKPFEKKKKRSTSEKQHKVSGADSGVSSASADEQDREDATSKQQADSSQEEEEEIPELVPIEAPSKKKNKKKEEIPVKKTKTVKKNRAPKQIPEQVEASPPAVKKKRKVIDPEQESPIKQKKRTPAKSLEEHKALDSLPEVLKKTPKKAAGKSPKLIKSSKKTPQTPKLKQKKRMKGPQSV